MTMIDHSMVWLAILPASWRMELNLIVLIMLTRCLHFIYFKQRIQILAYIIYNSLAADFHNRNNILKYPSKCICSFICLKLFENNVSKVYPTSTDAQFHVCLYYVWRPVHKLPFIPFRRVRVYIRWTADFDQRLMTYISTWLKPMQVEEDIHFE